MNKYFLPLLVGGIVVACYAGSDVSHPQQAINNLKPEVLKRNINTRYSPPTGYQRTKLDSNSFAHYLRHLPLKPQGEKVKYFDGQTKDDTTVYSAVVDLPIGKRDLHQCADAVMRLRAEYLWQQKRYAEISFRFENGFNMQYSKWKEGFRIRVKGNKVSWVKKQQASSSYKSFWKYLEMVFAYAGTASLDRQLPSVPMDSMQIGDVLIRGGHPGHSAIIVDMAVHPKSNKKCYLIAQSYMPAQETQILKNPFSKNNGSWYYLDDSSWITTPEYIFTSDELKRF